MPVITLDLVDHTLFKKIKPYQNGFMMLSGCCFLSCFVFSWYNSEIVAAVSSACILGAIVFLDLTLLLSLPFIWNKRIGTAVIEDDKIKVYSTSFEYTANLSDVCFKLAVAKKLIPFDGLISQDFLKILPKWGNCIFLENGACIDFLPNEQLTQIPERLNLTGYNKQPHLLMSTKYLAKQFADMLWGASI